jgi:hypothetical protein
MARVEANNYARQRREYLQTRSMCFCNLLDARNGDSNFCGTRGYCPFGIAAVSRKTLVHNHVRQLVYKNIMPKKIRSDFVDYGACRIAKAYIIFKLSSYAYPVAEFWQKDRLETFV